MIFVQGFWLYLVPAAATVIVGKRWPPPRWFLGTGSTPASGVVADGVDVVADGVQVVAT